MRRILLHSLLLTFAASSLFGQAYSAPEAASRGAEALAAGNYHEAVEWYSRAVEINPNYADAQTGLAEAFYWLEEYDQARTYIAEAERLARGSTHVLNLLGRILIGLGDLDGAREAFERAQAIEANNTDARIGLAELSLAAGQTVEAATYLVSALRLNPQHRKALLSLVLIYEQLGETETAEQYLDLALRVHRDSAEVHVLASEYYLRRGMIEEAAREARLAQGLDAGNRSATVLRAQAALLQERFDEALVISEELLATDQRDEKAWYLRAACLAALGESNEALESYSAAIRVAPDDGLVRLAAEQLALDVLPLDDSFRVELAAYRAETAASAVESYRHSVALAEYQRALQLTPFDSDLREAYADLHLVMGDVSTYLQEMELLQADDPAPDRATVIDVYRQALSESVAVQWSVDQFTLSRTPVRVGLFLDIAGSTFPYPRIDDAFLAFVEQTLRRQDNFEVVFAETAATYSEAFSEARSQDVDFFILLTASVAERTSQITARLHVARTGTLSDTLNAVRAGERRTAAAVDSVVDGLREEVPRLWHVVSRSGRRVLIDGGRRSGVHVGDELLVFAPGAVQLLPDTSDFALPIGDELGYLNVTRVDDLVAEAELSFPGLLDRVRHGDSVTARPGESDMVASESVMFPALYERVRRLR